MVFVPTFVVAIPCARHSCGSMVMVSVPTFAVTSPCACRSRGSMFMVLVQTAFVVRVLGSYGVRWCAHAPVCSWLRLECSCLVVIVITDTHLLPSLLYHSYFPSIAEFGLSAVVVNLLWLWALYKEFVFGIYYGV